MCSLLVIFSYQLFTTYSLLFLQYVNELFARAFIQGLLGDGYPFQFSRCGQRDN